jgi:hypothetical protein
MLCKHCGGIIYKDACINCGELLGSQLSFKLADNRSSEENFSKVPESQFTGIFSSFVNLGEI